MLALYWNDWISPMKHNFAVGLPSNSPLTVSQQEKAWSNKSLSAAGKTTGSGEVTHSMMDRSLWLVFVVIYRAGHLAA